MEIKVICMETGKSFNTVVSSIENLNKVYTKCVVQVISPPIEIDKLNKICYSYTKEYVCGKVENS